MAEQTYEAKKVYVGSTRVRFDKLIFTLRIILGKSEMRNSGHCIEWIPNWVRMEKYLNILSVKWLLWTFSYVFQNNPNIVLYQHCQSLRYWLAFVRKNWILLALSTMSITQLLTLCEWRVLGILNGLHLHRIYPSLTFSFILWNGILVQYRLKYPYFTFTVN